MNLDYLCNFTEKIVNIITTRIASNQKKQSMVHPAGKIVCHQSNSWAFAFLVVFNLADCCSNTSSMLNQQEYVTTTDST
jgi:hypothetical protein